MVLPPGVENPVAAMPAVVFRALLQRYLMLQRIDMSEIAVELGVGRATLYRYVGSRDHALGALVWFLMHAAFEFALDSTRSKRGVARVQAAAEAFMRFVHQQRPFRHWLHTESEIALRILTSKHGPVQGSVVEATRRLLDGEVASGTMQLNLDTQTLAYAIVRLGESFLYSDLIVGHPVDIDLAVEVIGRLIKGSTQTGTPGS